jgi:hypothetical protein
MAWAALLSKFGRGENVDGAAESDLSERKPVSVHAQTSDELSAEPIALQLSDDIKRRQNALAVRCALAMRAR